MRLILGTFLLIAQLLVGQTKPPERPLDPPLDPRTTQAILRGTQLAQAVATVTSTAISPLIGVCVMGAWEHFRTPSAERAKLPGYTSPWFWVPVAILLLLILAKDTIGGFTPLMKKPLDAVEVLLLNKASLFLIGFPVVFHEAAKLMGLDSVLQLLSMIVEPVVYAQDVAGAVERAGSISLAMLLVAGGLIITVAVWMTSHAIDVLVLLSPFPFVDLLLKAIRTAIFGVVALFVVIDPRVGALLSAFVILLSLLFFGWAFRLMIFGAVFSVDLLRTLVFGAYCEPRQGDALSGFLARRTGGLPKRSFGRVRRAGSGGLEFVSRRWVFGPMVTVALDSTAGYEVGRGLFHPSIVETQERSKGHCTTVRLLPRYRKSEDRMAVLLAVKGVRDVRFGSGMQSFWKWLKDDSIEPAVAS